MSTTIASIIVMILSQVLPQIGVNLGNAELTTVVSDLILVAAAIVAWVRHLALKKQVAGSVNIFGGKKQ